MDTRQAARGIHLTELGLGTSQLGNLGRATSDEDSASAVEAAWRSGIRYFDTAPHYGLGLSERRLGPLLRNYPRDEFVISTKVGRILEPNQGSFPDGETPWDTEGFAVRANYVRRFDLSRDGIRKSLNDSLSRLGMDRVDIAYLHDPDGREDEAVRTALPALAELRDEGLVRAVGAGMNSAAPLARFAREADVDILMVAGRLTLLDCSALDDLVDTASSCKVSLVAAGVFSSGLLATARPRPDAMFEYEPASRVIRERANLLADIAAGHGVDLPAVAIHYPLLWQEFASVVVGARSGAQVSDLIRHYETDVCMDVYDDMGLPR